MSITIVSSGQISSVFVTSGNIVDAIDGGELLNTQVQASGEVILGSGGIGNNTLISGTPGVAQATGFIQDGGVEDGGQVVNAGTLNVQPGGIDSGTLVGNVGAIVVGGPGALTEDNVVEGGGFLVVSAGGTALSATAAGDAAGQGVIEVFSGGLLSGANIGSSGVDFVFAGATASGVTLGSGGVEVDSGTVSGTVVSSGGFEEVVGGGVASGLTLDAGAALLISGGTATGVAFDSGASIDVRTLAFDGATSATLDAATDILSVTEGAVTDTLQLTGTYTGETFALAADGNGGTEITFGVVCFCRGTLIETDAGEVAVEKLREGDGVVTLAGAVRPVRWIGRRRKTITAGDPDAADLLPIRIEAGALGDGLPRRTLRVSPQHCFFLDDVLVPARFLVNGFSITRETCDRVEYYHVELDSHDVILAEGAAAETYLDTGNRSMFSNAPLVELRPDLSEDLDRKAASPGLCAPLVMSGERLQAIWARLDGLVLDGNGTIAAQRATG